MLQGSSSASIDDTLFDRLNRVSSFALAGFYVDPTFDQWLIHQQRAGTINVLSWELQQILKDIKPFGEAIAAEGVLIDAITKQVKYPGSLRTLLLSEPFHKVLEFFSKNITFFEKLFNEYTAFKTKREDARREKMLQALERLSLQSEPKSVAEVLDRGAPPLLRLSTPPSSSSTVVPVTPGIDYDYVSSLFAPANGTFLKLTNKISSKEKCRASAKFISTLVDLMQQKDFKLVSLILGRESVQSLKKVNESLIDYRSSIIGTESNMVSIVWDILQAVNTIQDNRAYDFNFKENFDNLSAKALSIIESRIQSNRPKP